MQKKWIDIAEKEPQSYEFCYFTDGRIIVEGFWFISEPLTKGKIDKLKKWAPLVGKPPKLK